MELRAAMRSRASTRPKRRGAGARGAAQRDDSEDEGGVSLAAIKNKYKTGQKGYTLLVWKIIIQHVIRIETNKRITYRVKR